VTVSECVTFQHIIKGLPGKKDNNVL
jgi:hypothetical protein